MLRPAVAVAPLDLHIAAFDQAGITQAEQEGAQRVGTIGRGRGAERKDGDDRRRWPWLRSRRERQADRGDAGAEPRDNESPIGNGAAPGSSESHSITSSARSSSARGTSMPSARAVFRLMINS